MFWRQYRDLIVMTHIQLGTPVVWCWDDLNVHLVDGCLPPTGLTMDDEAIRPPDSTSST